MSARRVVLSSFVLVALARAMCVLADDPSGKAVLGRAEPIGELLVLKVGFDDQPQPLRPVPIPQLEPKPFSIPPGLLLALAPVAAPPGCGALPATARIEPNEIPFHLSQAILGLTAAGLTVEAQQVSSLLKEFQTKHQARLLLVTKQAQLNELQAEIERLKLRVEKGITSDQIQLSIKIIEVDGQAAKELFGDEAKPVGSAPVNRLQSLSSLLAQKEFFRLVESKRKDGVLKVLAEPIMVSLSGRSIRFHSGGSIPTPQIAQAGGSTSIEYGTSVLATATIIDKDLIDLVFTSEVAELDPSNSVVLYGKSIPGVARRRIQSHVELKSGQTLVLGGLVSSKNEKTVETIITVTAEIIESMNEIAAPLVPPVEAAYPTLIPLRPLK